MPVIIAVCKFASMLILLVTLRLQGAGAKKLPVGARSPPPESHHTEPSESAVITIMNITAMDDIVATNSFVVVLFYAPWCGHSKMLSPAWTEAGLRVRDSGIVMAKVDLTRPSTLDLRIRYAIRGFPAMKIFKAHSTLPYEYRGPKDADGISQYLTVERVKCTSC